MLLARLTEPDASVVVAGLAAFAGVAAAGLTGYFGTKSKQAAKAANEVATAIGTPNGKGNVVEMNEKQLVKMGVIEEKIDFLSDLVLKHISTPNAHGGTNDRIPHESVSG